MANVTGTGGSWLSNTATLESQWHNWAYSWVGSEWIRTTLILKKVLKDPGSAGIYQIPNPPSNYFAEQLCVFALQSTESLFALVLPWSSIEPRKPLVFFRKKWRDWRGKLRNPGTGIACESSRSLLLSTKSGFAQSESASWHWPDNHTLKYRIHWMQGPFKPFPCGRSISVDRDSVIIIKCIKMLGSPPSFAAWLLSLHL